MVRIDVIPAFLKASDKPCNIGTGLFRFSIRNQMELYRTMQSSFEQQKRFLHDYKNQLGCVQGLLADGKTEEDVYKRQALAGLPAARASGGGGILHPAVS